MSNASDRIEHLEQDRNSLRVEVAAFRAEIERLKDELEQAIREKVAWEETAERLTNSSKSMEVTRQHQIIIDQAKRIADQQSIIFELLDWLHGAAKHGVFCVPDEICKCGLSRFLVMKRT